MLRKLKDFQKGFSQKHSEPELFPDLAGQPARKSRYDDNGTAEAQPLKVDDFFRPKTERYVGGFLGTVQFIFKKSPVKNFSGCFISALLLIIAFPRWELSLLAWVAFIPFMQVLDGGSWKRAFGLAYLTGVLFFAGTLYWFIHVTLPGAILIVLYLAVYFGLFGMACVAFARRRILEKLVFLPAAWVALEFLRAHLLTGFGWVSLGHSQYKHIGFIQMVDLTGVYGLSFLIMMVNVFFKEAVAIRLNQKDAARRPQLMRAFAIIVAALVMSGIYGSYQLRKVGTPPSIRVGVVQGNIPQEYKWSPRFYKPIFNRYFLLSRAAAVEKPDLLIWPETAFPAYLWENPELFEELKKFVAELRIPLLVGLVVREGENYYNSAMLFSGHGEVLKRYDKLHLVPFGEYIPLRKLLPFLEAIVPIGDFKRGEGFTLFPASAPIGDRDRVPMDFFNALICFEDTVPELSRGFVRAGSHLFINITNDAWFQNTNAPFLHQQAAIFRAIENRRELIRAANTGVSCFINRLGQMTRYVQGRHQRQTYVSGYAVQKVYLNRGETFYTKFGDIFTYLCFGVILGPVLRAGFRKIFPS